MKLRVVPVVASVVVSAVLLFGGWFAYQQWAVENPFQHKVSQMEGVKGVQTSITPNQVELNLDLAPNTDFAGLVRQIEADGKKLLGSRELKLTIKDQKSERLEQVWQEALFPIAQAMENKQYTEITAALEQLESTESGISAKADMDEKNVYITLTDGQVSKFIILPRAAQAIGVWPNA
ncbi:hypothetical protein [Paenibacillus brevis]|uniref:Uncharacterized protein n=1 Tax=Paenibacillus brevis TaxID=2841508 RepID=A0ABS6FW21_9BACL|nr:hypothetical protein [Paenibacillus brevis]